MRMYVCGGFANAEQFPDAVLLEMVFADSMVIVTVLVVEICAWCLPLSIQAVVGVPS